MAILDGYDAQNPYQYSFVEGLSSYTNRYCVRLARQEFHRVDLGETRAKRLPIALPPGDRRHPTRRDLSHCLENTKSSCGGSFLGSDYSSMTITIRRDLGTMGHWGNTRWLWYGFHFLARWQVVETRPFIWEKSCVPPKLDTESSSSTVVSVVAPRRLAVTSRSHLEVRRENFLRASHPVREDRCHPVSTRPTCPLCRLVSIDYSHILVYNTHDKLPIHLHDCL